MKNKLCRICQKNEKVKQYSYCKECQAVITKAWRENNIKYIKELKAKAWKNLSKDKRWDRHLKQRYGITNSQYLKMLNEQGGVCKICGGESMRIRLCVDHCHETGTVRGLLCERCNSILGRVKDNVEILQNSVNYLKGWVGK